MGELQVIWTILGLAARDHDAASPLAKAEVKWAPEQMKMAKSPIAGTG